MDTDILSRSSSRDRDSIRSVQLTPECRAALEKNPSQRDAEDFHHLSNFLASQRAFADTKREILSELSRTLMYERIEAGKTFADGEALYLFLNTTTTLTTTGPALPNGQPSVDSISITIAAGEKVGELAILRGRTDFKLSVGEGCETIKIHCDDYKRLLQNPGGNTLLRNADLIKRVGLFEFMPYNALAPICEALVLKSYPPNQVIVKQDTPPEGLFFVSSGQCRVIMKAKVGEFYKLLEVSTLRRDSFFGEVALIKGGNRRTSVVSNTNVTAYMLPKQIFHRYATGITLANFNEHISKYPSESDIVTNFVERQKWEKKKLKHLSDVLAVRLE